MRTTTSPAAAFEELLARVERSPAVQFDRRLRHNARWGSKVDLRHPHRAPER